MNSAKPKVLMEVLFNPMLGWVLDSVEAAGIERIGLIIGNNSEFVADFLTERALKKKGEGNDKKESATSESQKKRYETFLQTERKGTGHAVLQAEKLLREPGVFGGDVLVLCGDAPFMNAETITKAYEIHRKENWNVTVITASVNPGGNYGRVKRDRHSHTLSAIIEAKDCSPEELQITEVNSGAYWFKTDKLLSVLPLLSSDNSAGELYLTDCVEKLNSRAGTYTADDNIIVLGANDRKQLRDLNEKMIERINDTHYFSGVDIIGHNVIIGKDVEIGRDTILMPNTIIKGKTKIGSGCVIGPDTLISDCRIGDGVTLNCVQSFGAVIEDGVKAGPFVHIRTGTKRRWRISPI